MRGKDLPSQARLQIALECARYSDPTTGKFIARGRAAVKSMFPDVHIDTIRKIQRETRRVNLANPELVAQCIEGHRKGKCGHKSLLTNALKGKKIYLRVFFV